MFFDVCKSKGTAREAAIIYVVDYGWPSVRYGLLTKFDGSVVWVVELEDIIGPKGKEAQLARKYLGSTFEPVETIERGKT